ncbi:MAG: TIGR02147 family protein [Bacteriovoracia bacterium]
MSIFSHQNYRDFLKSYVNNLPKNGRGEIGKMAKATSIHPTLLSLIFSGKRDLSPEQTHDLAAYLKLTELEADYFSLLVQHARAGNHRLKSHLKKKILTLQAESSKLSQRFEHEKTLSEVERSIFYSSWLYSAVRLFASTSENGKTVDEITSRFLQPRQRVVGILNFLVSTGLVVAERDRYKIGPLRTFLEQGSPHLVRHHTNWRNKAVQKADQVSEEELMFTSPISLSREDFAKIREQMAELLKSVSVTVKESPAEEIACLNIDLFWIER